MKKITVVGTGYVGLSMAALLARKNEVTAVDIRQDRVDMINSGVSTIKDRDIQSALSGGGLHLTATMDAASAYASADYVIVSVPTNYDPGLGGFDTSAIKSVVSEVVAVNRAATIVIKSTVPVGYTKRLRERFCKNGVELRVLFSPEFLREGSALHDNLHPSRIVVGYDDDGLDSAAREFADMLVDSAYKSNIQVILTGTTEAEAIKLFANTYLAMRVAYFNELDTFTEKLGLDAKAVIDGVSADQRIGAGYNNPSFGYGGYCFPKDTRELLRDFYERDVPQMMVRAVVEANTLRKRHIVTRVLSMLKNEPSTVGVYRLAMKSGSDNSRESAVLDIMDALRAFGNTVIVYDPSIDAPVAAGVYELENDFGRFADRADVIIANRWDDELECVKEKVYTRDIYHNN